MEHFVSYIDIYDYYFNQIYKVFDELNLSELNFISIFTLYNLEIIIKQREYTMNYYQLV